VIRKSWQVAAWRYGCTSPTASTHGSLTLPDPHLEHLTPTGDRHDRVFCQSDAVLGPLPSRTTLAAVIPQDGREDKARGRARGAAAEA
jgi:hypothetical protein